MLQKRFDDSALSKARSFEWYEKCKEGRERVEDEERTGRPSTFSHESHFKKIQDLMLQNRRLTIRDLDDALKSMQTILMDVLCLKRANWFQKH